MAEDVEEEDGEGLGGFVIETEVDGEAIEAKSEGGEAMRAGGNVKRDGSNADEREVGEN